MDAGGNRPTLQSRNPRIREHEVAGISGDQPDGQSPRGAARRHDRHRGGGDLRLSCGRFSRGRSGAAVGLAPPRALLSLAVFRGGTGRSGQHQQGAQTRGAGRADQDGRLRHPGGSAGRARRSAQPLRLHSGRPLHCRGRLRRIAYRIWDDVRCDRQAACV